GAKSRRDWFNKVRQSTRRPRSPKEMTGAGRDQFQLTELARVTPRPELLVHVHRVVEERLGQRLVARKLAERAARHELAIRRVRRQLTVRGVCRQLTVRRIRRQLTVRRIRRQLTI